MNNQQTYMAFDLEIAKPLPDGAADWKAHRPLGISCAVTIFDRPEDLFDTKWHGEDGDGQPAPQMDQEDCRALAYTLVWMHDQGVKIITWNGLSFDFDILSEESGVDLSAVAMDHIDLMFMVFCARGHFLGLDKAAKGAGLAGKTEGMDGALAPQMWAEGKYREVLDYCAQDVRTTLDLARWIGEHKNISWTATSGRFNTVPFPDGLLTVRQCLALPEPDTSWMREPVGRERFTSWMTG